MVLHKPNGEAPTEVTSFIEPDALLSLLAVVGDQRRVQPAAFHGERVEEIGRSLCRRGALGPTYEGQLEIRQLASPEDFMPK